MDEVLPNQTFSNYQLLGQNDSLSPYYFYLYPNSDQSQIITSCYAPGFCSNEIYLECWEQPLNDCTKCNLAHAVVFIFFAIILGLGIMLGNLLIVMVGCQRFKNGKADKMDLCKSSLATANALTGWCCHRFCGLIFKYCSKS